MTVDSPREFFRTTIAAAAGADCPACRLGPHPCPGCAAEALLDACRREDLIVLTRDAGESMVDALAEQIFGALKNAARDLQDIGASVLGATLGVATGRSGEGVYRLTLTEASRTAARVALGVEPAPAAEPAPRIPGGAAGLAVLRAVADGRVVQTDTETRMYERDGAYSVVNGQIGELGPAGLLWRSDPAKPGSLLVAPRLPDEVWYLSDGPLPAAHDAIAEGRAYPLPRGRVRVWHPSERAAAALRNPEEKQP